MAGMSFRSTYALKFRIEGASEMRSSLKDIKQNLKDIAGVHTATIKTDVQKVKADAVMPAAATATILGRVKGIGAAFFNVKTLVLGIGAAVAGLGIKEIAERFVGVGKGIMTTTESLKKMRLGMEGIYGDEAKAKMEWLLKASMDLPGTLEEFAAGALRIKAMGGLFGMDIEDMRDGKTILEDLVKLAAIRPDRGFLGILDPATMWVFAEYDRSLRFAVGATKSLMSEISGISEEAMAGAGIEATKNRMEALRAYISTISDEVLEKYKTMLTTAVGSFETIAKVGIETIGNESGMYQSITDCINKINKTFEELQGSKVWDEIKEKFGGPFRDIADKISDAIDEAKAVLESGGGIEDAVEKFGDIVSEELRKQSVKIGKAAYAVGKYVAWPMIKGMVSGATGLDEFFKNWELFQKAAKEHPIAAGYEFIRWFGPGGMEALPAPTEFEETVRRLTAEQEAAEKAAWEEAAAKRAAKAAAKKEPVPIGAAEAAGAVPTGERAPWDVESTWQLPEWAREKATPPPGAGTPPPTGAAPTLTTQEMVAAMLKQASSTREIFEIMGDPEKAWQRRISGEYQRPPGALMSGGTESRQVTTDADKLLEAARLNKETAEKNEKAATMNKEAGEKQVAAATMNKEAAEQVMAGERGLTDEGLYRLAQILKGAYGYTLPGMAPAAVREQAIREATTSPAL